MPPRRLRGKIFEETARAVPARPLSGLFVLFIIIGSFSVAAAEGRNQAGTSYQVQSGDTLWSIARRHGVSIQDLAQVNNISEPSALKAGQKIIIPGGGYDYLNKVCAVRPGVKLIDWKYIVVHHSATSIGNARRFDYFHRKVLHMPRGMAYHFVIGNGRGLGNGKIEVGSRWKLQHPGGHVRSEAFNEIAIGICLVGNFDQVLPTPEQMESLHALVCYLQAKFGIPRRRVIGHREVKGAGTRCPGKLFPLLSFRSGVLP